MPEVSTQAPQASVAPAAVPPPLDTLPTQTAGSRVSLATAFTALLAAEQSMPNAGAGLPAAVSEHALEDVVRRILLNDDRVRRMVLEAAERMVKEEIERIKSAPDSVDAGEPETQ